MISCYQRRAARLAALAASTNDPKERRKLEYEKQICEELIRVLQNVYNREEKT